MARLARVAAILPLALSLSACTSGNDPARPPAPSPTARPAAVDDLAVVAATDASITLAWTTPGVAGDDRPLAAYDLRRAVFGQQPAAWTDWLAVPLPPPAAPGAPARATIDGLEAGATWIFRLRARGSGDWSDLSAPAVATVDPQWDRTPPAAVADLAQRWRSADQLFLTWPSTGDDAAYGEAAAYEVRHAAVPLDPEGWDAAAIGPAPAFDRDLSLWTCRLDGLDGRQTVHAALKAVDDAGNWSALSNVVAAAPPAGQVWHVAVDGTGTVPTIAEGIRQAGYRDLVLVHPGRYTWTNQDGPMHHLGMIFVGRDTTDFTLASALGPESTILDAEGRGCVVFIQGYNDGVVLDGFTITGGAISDEGQHEDPLPGGLTFHLTSTTVRNCIFEDNHGGQGGAIGFFGVGRPTIERCVIRNNHATLYGGGVFAINVHGPGQDADHGISLIDCVIEDNTSDGVGGGLAFYNAVALVRDCVIAGNAAGTSGGGVLIGGRSIGAGADAWVRIEGSTIARNTAPLASAVRVTATYNNQEYRDGQGRMIRCIVADHFYDEPLSIRQGSVLEIGCSDLFANVNIPRLPPGAVDLGGNFWLDPLFCGSGANDPWTVDAASPCLPGAHPDGEDCELVGARGAGCGSSSR